jgi:hypothetical protein
MNTSSPKSERDRRTLKRELRSDTWTSPAMYPSAMPRSPKVTSLTQNVSERTLITTLGPPLNSVEVNEVEVTGAKEAVESFGEGGKM